MLSERAVGEHDPAVGGQIVRLLHRAGQAVLRLPVRVDDDAVVVFAGVVDDLISQIGGEGLREVEHRESEQAGRACFQRARGQIDGVVQFVHRREHAFARRFAHAAGAVDYVRDRFERHSGLGGNVFDGHTFCHDASPIRVAVPVPVVDGTPSGAHGHLSWF